MSTILFATDLSAATERIQFVIEYAKLLEGSLTLAEHQHADLVVLDKHNRSSISLMFGGSVSRAVLSKPPCDVLVARV